MVRRHDLRIFLHGFVAGLGFTAASLYIPLGPRLEESWVKFVVFSLLMVFAMLQYRGERN